MMAEFFRAIRERIDAFRPGSLLFANCCLNSPARLYTNPRIDGLFIWDLAPYLDLVLIEDSGLQACRNAEGRCVEYSHMYHIIRALSRGKPLAAITSQPGEWYNEPALTPLSIAEAVANEATAVIAGRELAGADEATVRAPIRNYLRFFRDHADDLAAAVPAVDVALFYHRLGWLKKDRSPAPEVALALSGRSIQYRVIAEDDLAAGRYYGAQAVIVADPALLIDAERHRLGASGLPVIEAATPEQAACDAARAIRAPSVEVAGSPFIRAFRRDADRTIYLHLINYDATLKGRHRAAYTPSGPLKLRVSLPAGNASIRAAVTSPDRPGEPDRSVKVERAGGTVKLTLPSVRTHELVTLQLKQLGHRDH